MYTKTQSGIHVCIVLWLIIHFLKCYVYYFNLEVHDLTSSNFVFCILVFFSILIEKMKIGLIIFTFLLITIKDILCGRLGALEYAISNECPSQEEISKCHCKVVAGGKKK